MTEETIQRKIDQAYELAALAIADGDYADATKHYAEVARLTELLPPPD